MTLHPFEKAGLGKAPFRCVGVTTNWYVTAGGAHRQPGGSCDYCGTGILYEYHIVGADGSKFVVGSDCVAKTGGHQHVEGFKKAKSDMLAAKRSAKRAARAAEREAAWKAKVAEKRAAFDAAEPGLYATVKALGETSNFFKEMAWGIDHYGSLTPAQLAAVKRILTENMAKARLEAASEYVGEVGKALTGTFTVLRRMSWTSQFYPHPVTYLHVMESGGNLFVYKGSNAYGKGEKVTGTFTVKAHEEYKGAKQTVLARPRKVTVEGAADAAEEV